MSEEIRELLNVQVPVYAYCDSIDISLYPA